MPVLNIPRPSYKPKMWPTPPGCVLYLEGQQDPQSGVIKDLSGYNNHGTITGATWVRNEKGLWVNSFDGMDDKIQLPDLTTYFTDSATFITWIKLDVQTPLNAVQSGHWYISTTADGHYPFTDGKLYINTFRANRVDGIDDANDRTIWHMVTITTTPGVNNWKLYHNTTLLAQTNAEVTIAISAFGGKGSWLGTGATGIDYYLDGMQILQKLLTRALSATEISQIWSQERTLFGV